MTDQFLWSKTNNWWQTSVLLLKLTSDQLQIMWRSWSQCLKMPTRPSSRPPSVRKDRYPKKLIMLLNCSTWWWFLQVCWNIAQDIASMPQSRMQWFGPSSPSPEEKWGFHDEPNFEMFCTQWHWMQMPGVPDESSLWPSLGCGRAQRGQGGSYYLWFLLISILVITTVLY